MRLPDFVVIGAAKSGTTSLYALLERHPEIFMPHPKEPEFFARDDLYAKGIDSYARIFADARADQLLGEASTLYTLAPLYPETAARLAKHAPNARLIYMMRQPVDRAYSFYVQLIKTYQNSTGDLAVHRSFEEFIDPVRNAGTAPREKVLTGANAHLPDTPELCLAASDYVLQIETWLEHFPKEQMLFLKFEDFVADRPAVMKRITDFLGLAPLNREIFDEKGVTRNIAADHFREMTDRRAVEELKGRAGGLWGLRRLLPAALRKRLRQKVSAVASADNTHMPSEMYAATRAQLTTRYRAQETRLAALTGLSFEDWWR